MEKIQNRHISLAILALKASIAAYLAWRFFAPSQVEPVSFDGEFLLFCLAGFLAQIVDGALGMAYGATCSTILLNLGIPPAVASASVHAAEVFTTGASGLSHLHLKNVDRKLLVRLALPGVAGACIGAFLLSKILNGDLVKPWVSAYLLVLGVLILVKSFREPLFKEEIKNVAPLGFFGGLLDAVGGGGWGPVVTSNLIRQGKTPQLTIGTVNTAEFFVAFFSTGVFLLFLGLEGWKTVLGLVVGGVVAAPLGARLVRFIQPRQLMFLVGAVIILTSCFTIWKSL